MEKFDQFGNEYQEYSKGDDELLKLKDTIKAEVGFSNENEGDPQAIAR